MIIGLDEFRGGKWNSLRWLLYMPFVTQLKKNPLAVNRRDPFDESD